MNDKCTSQMFSHFQTQLMSEVLVSKQQSSLNKLASRQLNYWPNRLKCGAGHDSVGALGEILDWLSSSWNLAFEQMRAWNTDKSAHLQKVW